MSKALPRVFHAWCIGLLAACTIIYSTVAAEPTTVENTSPELRTFKIGVSSLDHYPHFNFESTSDKGLSWAILQAFAEKYN